jgi:hypothetical protein
LIFLFFLLFLFRLFTFGLCSFAFSPNNQSSIIDNQFHQLSSWRGRIPPYAKIGTFSTPKSAPNLPQPAIFAYHNHQQINHLGRLVQKTIHPAEKAGIFFAGLV